MAKRLLGIGAPRQQEVQVIPDVVEKPNADAASILSIPTDKSERIKVIDSWKEKRKKKADFSSTDSVLSDVTFSMAPGTGPPKEIVRTPNNKASTDEFILECDNGERIYVPSTQGMVIKSRCRQLRLSLESNKESMYWGAGSVSDSDSVSKGPEHRIISKKTWSPRTARHIIELLLERSTWIQNDQNRFVELLRACDEINVRLHLGSPINYHDVLSPASTLRYFKLADNRKYRFQLSGTIHSSQWMNLIEKGILLHLDSNVLMLSTAPSIDRSEESEATKRRLAKCNKLYSEFNVYSGRSRINALYTILSILSSSERKIQTEKVASRKRSTGKESFEESIKIVCKIVSGGLRERDLNTLWRMTSSSYTLSTPEEQSLLQCHQALFPTEQSRCSNLPFGDIKICHSQGLTASTEVTCPTEVSDPTEVTNPAETAGPESVEESSSHATDSSQASQNSPIQPSPPPSTPDPPVKHEMRTITGKSFVALKHVFEPVNGPDKYSSVESRDPSLLPACLSITNPTPDTLGRFLNACAARPGKGSDDNSITRIGYDILPSSASTNGKRGMLFFVSNTTRRVKEILDTMADYSGTSVVGDADFRLEERRHV